MIRTRILRTLAGIAVAVPAALLLGAPPAAAHPMPHSVVLLDVHEASVTAKLELPVSDLSRASGLELTAATLPAQQQALLSYLSAHIRPATTAGRRWKVSVGAASLSAAEQTSTGTYQQIDATASLTPPAGGDVRHFVLGYDVIVHKVVTHTVLVAVRQDWASGQVGAGTRQVGTIEIDSRSMTVPALTVNLEHGSAWAGFVAMVKLGGNHILTGTDHLLFLLVLLLPAGLLAAGGRWRGLIGPRVAVGRIGRTTLAFTVGHSVALALSALTHLVVPAWPVEAFIAVSILVGAIHAIRPLFPGREAMVAGLFGLGHGLAFSFTLAEMDLSTGQVAVSLLGFNLGIEMVQLLLVALALPALVAVARTRRGPVFRFAVAAVTGVAATGWLADRLGLANPVARAADSAGADPKIMLILLTVAAVTALGWTVLDRGKRAAARTTGPAMTSELPNRVSR
jgi:hypothetical protein